MTSEQHQRLREFLLPGDGLEAVAILVCGRAGIDDDEVMVVHEIIDIPYDRYTERSADRVTWPTEMLAAILPAATRKGLGIAKIHSHPGGFANFSSWDDESDRRLFPGVYGWAGTERPHLSAIMLPDGAVRARVVRSDGTFDGNVSVTVVGNRISTWGASPLGPAPTEIQSRTRQAFGDQTIETLRSLRVGVVGCSGTGSWVVELLARLGVGELVLVDPDNVEDVNLNRIVHASTRDADQRRPKVDVLADAIRRSGLPTDIETFAADVYESGIVRRLSRCDVLFGCVDSIDARDLLSRMSVFYILPYIDVGVRLVADGAGGVSHIAGSANYVTPDLPSLMDRGLYSPKQLADAGLRRSDPAAYADQQKVGYISGAQVSRPAVASVNAFYASLAVTEMLHRIHGFRDEEAPLGVTISLSQLRVLNPGEGVAKSSLSKRTGRGDLTPLLDLPALSE
jgi:hypothetical protein